MEESYRDYDILILRVGGIDGNFKNSVLSKVGIFSCEDESAVMNPTWGYNKNKFCGFPSVSKRYHNMILNDSNNIMLLFKPNRSKSYNGNLLGLAKIDNVRERPANELIPIAITDEELGWQSATKDRWDTLFDIVEYWDLSIFKDNIFSDTTLMKHGKKLGQQTAHMLSSSGSRSALHSYLNFHVNFITNNIKSTYVVPQDSKK